MITIQMTTSRQPDENKADIRSNAAIKKDLAEIRQQTLTANHYHLSSDEISDLNIVLNTLDYLVDHLDIPEFQNYTIYLQPYTNYYNFGSLPKSLRSNKTSSRITGIHLDSKHMPTGSNRKRAILNNLIEPFILAFKNVQASGNKHVKKFCGKLYGICIDARTRAALDYGLALSVTFSEMMGEAIAELPKKDKNNYFSVIAAIIKHYWGNKFSADRGKNAYHLMNGEINEQCLPIIRDFLKEIILCNELSNRFIEIFDSIPFERLPIFFRLILIESDFIHHLSVNTNKEKNQFDEMVIPFKLPIHPSLLDIALEEKEFNHHDTIAALLRNISEERFLLLGEYSQKNRLNSIIHTLGITHLLALAATKLLNKTDQEFNDFLIKITEKNDEQVAANSMRQLFKIIEFSSWDETKNQVIKSLETKSLDIFHLAAVCLFSHDGPHTFLTFFKALCKKDLQHETNHFINVMGCKTLEICSSDVNKLSQDDLSQLFFLVYSSVKTPEEKQFDAKENIQTEAFLQSITRSPAFFRMTEYIALLPNEMIVQLAKNHDQGHYLLYNVLVLQRHNNDLLKQQFELVQHLFSPVFIQKLKKDISLNAQKNLFIPFFDAFQINNEVKTEYQEATQHYLEKIKHYIRNTNNINRFIVAVKAMYLIMKTPMTPLERTELRGLQKIVAADHHARWLKWKSKSELANMLGDYLKILEAPVSAPSHHRAKLF